MFDNLTARLSRTIDNLRGRGRITEDNIGEAMREVRVALLEAERSAPGREIAYILHARDQFAR